MEMKGKEPTGEGGAVVFHGRICGTHTQTAALTLSAPTVLRGLRLQNISNPAGSTGSLQPHILGPDSSTLPCMGTFVGVEPRKQPGELQEHRDAAGIGVCTMRQPLGRQRQD